MGQSGRVLIRLPPAHFPRNLGESTYNFHCYFVISLQIFLSFPPSQSMENKIVTLLGMFEFSTVENQVSEHDVQTLGSTTELLVIHFDQEKFEQLLSGGSASSLHVRKHRKSIVTRALLDTAWKQVSVETNKALCESIMTSSEAKTVGPRGYTLHLFRVLMITKHLGAIWY